MEWFKKHPQFLRKESLALSNDSNYQELFQMRNKLFISHGNVLVRLDRLHRFPILIVYTDATPYQLPIVFPLKSTIAKEEMEVLSQLSISELVEKISDQINFYYELRHQNATGDLCILERENLDSKNSFYGITTILQRVRDWFAGHLTGQFPPESLETEFTGHFKNINREIKFIYPEHFLNEKLIEGDCYARLLHAIPESRFSKFIRYIYFGSFIDGVSQSGLIEEVNISLKGQFPVDNINNTSDLYEKKETVNRLIEEKKLLKASWFHIDKEPMPFKQFRDLISIIGNGDFENGIKRITKRCSESFIQLPDSFLFGIRFPNRKGANEFQLFKIHKGSSNDSFVISSDVEENMRNILARYDMVEAIVGEKITEEIYFQRNGRTADFTVLSRTEVNVLGVGAIGSEIADCINKAGIGRILLVDYQPMSAHNAVRHLAGLENTGELKVNAVAEILRNHNPFNQIGIAPFNLFIPEISESMEADSISISSVADDNVEGFINQQFVISNKAAFYVRALRGGKVARIFRVIPGQDACFNCLSLYRADKKEFIEIPDDPNYPTLRNECNNPIRPASAADLKFIASFASRLLINHLQNEDNETNHWIWSSEKLEGTPINTPYQVYRQNFSPHPNCFYCNHEKQIKVAISSDAISFMRQEVAINPSIETGGVLAGEIDGGGNINITHVSGAGPKAIRSENQFEKDVDYCQKYLDDLYKETNYKVVYVGEWHSHPSINNNPSSTDIKSLSEIALQCSYLTECPVMIIFSNNGNPSTTIHPAGKRFYYTSLVINDSSSIAKAENITTEYSN